MRKGWWHREPVFTIAFDSAHIFGRDHDSWSSQSVFELRRALSFRSAGPDPVASFALFVSVSAHSPQHTLMKGEYIASRHVGFLDRVGNPFTDLGFDQFATMTNWDDVCPLEKVITDAHMVTLGRPLYVYFSSGLLRGLTTTNAGSPRGTTLKTLARPHRGSSTKILTSSDVTSSRLLPRS